MACYACSGRSRCDGLERRVGASPEAARGRLDRFGANALGERQRRSLIGVFLRQFKSPLIYLLFVAAGLALALGNVRDAIVIFTVVLLNAVIGGVQEGRAERSLEALRKLTTQRFAPCAPVTRSS